MTQDRPNLVEILATVAEFARQVAARSEGGERYDALCAAFLLEVATRELEVGDRADRRQREHLLTRLDAPLDADLYATFCAQVRAGELDADWDWAFAFALEQVIDKVAITNPMHLAPAHRR